MPATPEEWRRPLNSPPDGTRLPGPITEAVCWRHAPLISPLDGEDRIDPLHRLEGDRREHDGRPAAAARLARRQADIAPLVAELESWMTAERTKLSRHADAAKAMDYVLKR